jgi:hypothetical protein
VNLSFGAWEQVRGSLDGAKHSQRQLKGKLGLTDFFHLDPSAIKWNEA